MRVRLQWCDMNTNRRDPLALITGAGRGIGRAIAIELAQRGYQLLLTARTKSELNETAKLAGKATVVAGDVTQPAHARKLIAKVRDLGSRLDVVVNNAGYAPAFSIEKISLAEWDKIMATNLSSAFYLCKFAWPIFVRQNGGVVVNISSVASRDPFPGLGFYGAAKAGLNMLGFDLARQGRAHNVRVYTLALAAVETQMLRKLITPEEYPPDQTLRPADVAAAVYSCISGPLQHTSGEVVYLRK